MDSQVIYSLLVEASPLLINIIICCLVNTIYRFSVILSIIFLRGRLQVWKGLYVTALIRILAFLSILMETLYNANGSRSQIPRY